ncbi:Voltage-dependent anion channel [Acididesulfobacillus acetoxydans]|uniref:C4-dicarboxylate transporter/malic acid transport protein n=1 Tax=Acididesulfobacillus acetoxydans TaxID=1561005 RepID=A0A8S0XCK9_9FIRM|nr:C4-dicarboxylate ABC transporter [Acididesulfobacillus acetoxydans]CAA7602576.1 Voltage-dependent anion channel [Acididesulfobacillus acetoxydans]CEJ07278.1 C4-dicarboxylate transporter/malic acid transport protein [Acididesulfobacillus acetoxydans]
MLGAQLKTGRRQIDRRPSLSRQFGTNWFTVVMGIGIVAALSYASPIALPGRYMIGKALFLLVSGVFLVALALWVRRWFHHTDEALKDFSDPNKALFYGALAMGINVVGNDFLIIGTHLLSPATAILMSKVIWLCGVAVSLFTIITVPYLLFVTHQVSLEDTHASWLIPIVPPIVAAATGTNLIPYWNSPAQQFFFTILILAMFGMTFFLFIMVSSLYYSRLVYKGKIGGGFVPSVWIEIGPIGMSMTVFSNLPFVTQSLFGAWSSGFHALGIAFAIAMWGVGIWWIVIASLYSLLHLTDKDSTIPYSLGWWSYVFPLGSFTTGTYALNRLVGHSFFAVAGLIQFLVLAGFFSLVAIKTLIGIWNGSLLPWRSSHLRLSQQKV